MLKFPNTVGSGINCGSGSLYNGQSFTLACWVHRYGTGTTVSTGTGGQLSSEPIFTAGVGESETLGLNCAWFLGFSGSAVNKFTTDFEDRNNGLNHPHTFTANTGSFNWPVHVAVTYNNSSSLNTGSWIGYINGIQDSTSNINSTNSLVRTPDTGSKGQGVGIGVAINSSAVRSGAFNGVISEVAMWNTVLTSTEILQLATCRIIGMPLQIQSSSLQGYWPLNETQHEGTASTVVAGIQDRSGRGRHGTAFGILTGVGEYILSYNS